MKKLLASLIAATFLIGALATTVAAPDKDKKVDKKVTATKKVTTKKVTTKKTNTKKTPSKTVVKKTTKKAGAKTAAKAVKKTDKK